jgi:hypothetical protein
MLLTLGYDMRAPDFGTPASRLYSTALEQCEWADRAGFAAVTFMEHHASTDGYLPSPIVMAAAAAARTQRVFINIALMILPLYEPLRVPGPAVSHRRRRLPGGGVRAVRPLHLRSARAHGARGGDP